MLNKFKWCECYCYNDDCNQKEWERLGKLSKSKYTTVSALYCPSIDKHVPKCPYCKKKMIVIANMSNDDY